MFYKKETFPRWLIASDSQICLFGLVDITPVCNFSNPVHAAATVRSTVQTLHLSYCCCCCCFLNNTPLRNWVNPLCKCVQKGAVLQPWVQVMCLVNIPAIYRRLYTDRQKARAKQISDCEVIKTILDPSCSHWQKLWCCTGWLQISLWCLIVLDLQYIFNAESCTSSYSQQLRGFRFSQERREDGRTCHWESHSCRNSCAVKVLSKMNNLP